MKTIALSIIMALSTAQITLAYTASEVFPGRTDGLFVKGEYVRKGTIKASIDNIAIFYFGKRNHCVQ